MERASALAPGAKEHPLEKASLRQMGRRKGRSGQSALPAGLCPGCPVSPDSGV